MKNIFSIMILAVGLLLTQACAPKKNNAAEVSAEMKETKLTAAEKRAKFEKQRAERAERRRLEYERIAINTPTYNDVNGNLVYNKAESDPSFVGGDKAMLTYLKDNVKFPQEALENQDEGVVFVDFVIDKNGVVRNVEVMDITNEDVDQSFRSEAIRVVSAMPKWSPGLQHGKAVDVKYSVPISFEIQ